MTRPATKSKKKPAKPLAATKVATRSAPVKVETAIRFAPRARVIHRSFGAGVVQSVDGDKLEIKFAKAGVKWIVDSYVTQA